MGWFGGSGKPRGLLDPGLDPERVAAWIELTYLAMALADERIRFGLASHDLTVTSSMLPPIGTPTPCFGRALAAWRRADRPLADLEWQAGVRALKGLRREPGPGILDHHWGRAALPGARDEIRVHEEDVATVLALSITMGAVHLESPRYQATDLGRKMRSTRLQGEFDVVADLAPPGWPPAAEAIAAADRTHRQAFVRLLGAQWAHLAAVVTDRTVQARRPIVLPGGPYADLAKLGARGLQGETASLYGVDEIVAEVDALPEPLRSREYRRLTDAVGEAHDPVRAGAIGNALLDRYEAIRRSQVRPAL